MAGPSYLCRVVEKYRLSPTVMGIRFEPQKRFSYYPGQFITLRVPNEDGSELRRLYTLASPYEIARKEGYELCVKLHPGGMASRYVCGLEVGDQLKIHAPFGDFGRHLCRTEKPLCFIATGTGVSPLRAIALSRSFERMGCNEKLCLLGARDRQEILFPSLFETLGFETVHALSRSTEPLAFHGRVTDYLSDVSLERNWAAYEFYICGNGEMVTEVVSTLVNQGKVPKAAIHFERFSSTPIIHRLNFSPREISPPKETYMRAR